MSSSLLFYQILSLIPRHGFSQKDLIPQIRLFYYCCFLDSYLLFNDIFFLRINRSKMWRLFQSKQVISIE